MSTIRNLEQRLLYERYGKMLWLFRLQPWHAAHYLAGVFLPPHERFWLGVYFSDYKENNVVASRGTSKSYTHASLAAPLKALLYKNLTLTTLSASGFRGGKELFKDAGRMFDGQLRSQRPFGDFLRASVKSNKVIAKDPSMWEMLLRSFSRYNTVPTNNEEQLRGLRTNKLQIDERNTFPGEVVHKILRPMMNVGLDFRRPASGGDANQIYQVSTIDFTVRDWYPELQVAEQLQKREYDAYKARKAGDWEEYDRLMEENDGQLRGASYSYTRIDYTDLLIPEYITPLDGEHRYKVSYPREVGVELDDILRYDEHEKQNLYYTYPVDKKGLEEPLRSGTVDDDIWKAEQRNIFIRSSGNVFPYDLIQKIAERPIWQAKEAPKGKRRGVDEDDDGSLEEYFAPLLFTCGDPCVLGVDVARESDDISFVVIRLGELAEGVFDPFTEKTDEQGRTVLGKTPWNHICWAESHKLLQAHQVADKIREFYHRYNLLVAVQTPMRPRIAGLAMDKRGNGTAVRDELGNPKPPVGPDGKADPTWDWKTTLKIYDPEDDTGFGHYQALPSPDPKEYWGGMQLVATDNQDNIDWTFGARALMQQKKLYLAYWMPPSRWAWEKGLLGPNGEPDKHNPEYVKWETGYQGIRRLKSQLLRLQTKISETGVIRFVMPGNRQKEEGKKDLWAGMIYAVGLVRAHLVATTKASQQAPMIAPVVMYPEDMGVKLFGGAVQRRI